MFLFFYVCLQYIYIYLYVCICTYMYVYVCQSVLYVTTNYDVNVFKFQSVLWDTVGKMLWFVVPLFSESSSSGPVNRGGRCSTS